MSTNDILENMVGLRDDLIPLVTEEYGCEEINYDDIGGSYTSDPKDEYEEEIHTTTKKRPSRKLGKEVQALQFRNPGDKTSQQMPSDSSEMIGRNRARRAVMEVKDEDWHHDKTGRLSYTVKGQKITYDLCDCLVPECTGCQWPCKTCKSRKCLVGCRQGRRDMIGRTEEMYTIIGNSSRNVTENSYVDFPNKG